MDVAGWKTLRVTGFILRAQDPARRAVPQGARRAARDGRAGGCGARGGTMVNGCGGSNVGGAVSPTAAGAVGGCLAPDDASRGKAGATARADGIVGDTTCNTMAW